METRTDRTFLAIDYGRRRVGIAKSDSTGLIASALVTLETKNMANAVGQVLGLIEEYEPNALVVGFPLLESGKKGERCKEVDKFLESLGRIYGGPIHKVDERFSTAEARKIIHAHGKKIGQDKRRLDRLAAVIILQRFLDEQTQ